MISSINFQLSLLHGIPRVLINFVGSCSPAAYKVYRLFDVAKVDVLLLLLLLLLCTARIPYVPKVPTFCTVLSIFTENINVLLLY